MTAEVAPIVVIPVYNHGAAVGAVVAGVLQHKLPLILVDDGSEPGCAAVLDELTAHYKGHVNLLRLPSNQGKGGAMVAGLCAASLQGYTHGLQIDADGQHDTARIPEFLQQAQAHPKAVICGCPVYDAQVPKARLYGRYLTHVWVWINTLSLQIRDSMCGFRVYPLDTTVRLLQEVHIGRRMEFDIEVLVRLFWRGVGVVNVPTPVTYPSDGVSHFRVWRDNVLISRTHARLFLGMLIRLPLLVWRALRPS